MVFGYLTGVDGTLHGEVGFRDAMSCTEPLRAPKRMRTRRRICKKKHIQHLSIENRLESMEAHQMVGRALGKGSYWTSPSPPGIDLVPPRG